MTAALSDGTILRSRRGMLLAVACLAGCTLARWLYRRTTRRNRWNLRGKVAVVTGGSRGVGRGVCIELGRAGATVYVVGRSRASGPVDLPGHVLGDGTNLGGTIDETAEEVTRLGGIGVPVECDCSSDDDMRSLFERVRNEQFGRLDILVNCAILIRHDVRQRPPFWEQELEVYDSYHTVGTRSTYVMSALAVPLMLESVRTHGGGGRDAVHPLIVNVSSPGATMYMFNVAYGVGKAGLDRIGKDMHIDLRQQKTNINIVTLHPGMVKTERMLAQQDAFRRKFHVDVGNSESVFYTGRTVCALADSASTAKKYSGRVASNTKIANELNFTDVDGRRPPELFTLAFYVTQVLPVLVRDFLSGSSRQQKTRDAAGAVSGH